MLHEKTEKEKLIEMIQNHLQKSYRLSYLDSKIVVLLMIEDDGQGITFDQFIKMTGSSKSSVSSSLKNLLYSKRVFFHKKEHARRRYFKISSAFMGISQLLKNVETESLILDEIILYKEQNNQNRENVFENIVKYRDFLSSLETFLLKSITSI